MELLSERRNLDLLKLAVPALRQAGVRQPNHLDGGRNSGFVHRRLWTRWQDQAKALIRIPTARNRQSPATGRGAWRTVEQHPSGAAAFLEPRERCPSRRPAGIVSRLAFSCAESRESPATPV